MRFFSQNDFLHSVVHDSCHMTAFLIRNPAVTGLYSNCCFDKWPLPLLSETELLNHAVTQNSVACLTNPDTVCLKSLTNPDRMNIFYLQLNGGCIMLTQATHLTTSTPGWLVAVKNHFIVTFLGLLDANSYNLYPFLKWGAAPSDTYISLVNVLCIL